MHTAPFWKVKAFLSILGLFVFLSVFTVLGYTNMATNCSFHKASDGSAK